MTWKETALGKFVVRNLGKNSSEKRYEKVQRPDMEKFDKALKILVEYGRALDHLRNSECKSCLSQHHGNEQKNSSETPSSD